FKPSRAQYGKAVFEPEPRRNPFLGIALTALLAINAALVGWRTEVVRLLPQTASLYAAIGLPVNLRGLVFADVKTDVKTEDGEQVLLVEGKILNTQPRLVDVPRMRFAIRNEDGQEVYSWTAAPPRNIIAPNEMLPFRARLASPPHTGEDVLVRFFDRRDIVAAI